jgi:hypothetical protein
MLNGPTLGCTRKWSRPPQNGQGPAYSPPFVEAACFRLIVTPITSFVCRTVRV